jgi:hypothetical protein
MENDSQADRIRNLIAKRVNMPTDLQADPMHISVEELVRRAFAVVGNRVVSDAELIEICAGFV